MSHGNIQSVSYTKAKSLERVKEYHSDMENFFFFCAMISFFNFLPLRIFHANFLTYNFFVDPDFLHE